MCVVVVLSHCRSLPSAYKEVEPTIPGDDALRESDPQLGCVWLDGDCVILIDVAHPDVRDTPDALAARLGAPTTSLPARNNPTHEDLVYLDRGLTITVGGKFETPPNPRVSYLFVYAPTPLDDYVGRLGGKDEWVRRFPVRRQRSNQHKVRKARCALPSHRSRVRASWLRRVVHASRSLR